MSKSDLKKWPVCRQLKPKFIKKINMVFVYGYPGNKAVILTKDDMVYALGSTLNPTKVHALCQKGVKTFASGEDFVLALTNSGEVYSWAYDKSSQHEDGPSEPGLIPSIDCLDLGGKVVIDIACSGFHSLALTDKGEVFAWGLNDCGQLGYGLPLNAPSEVSANPTKVNAVLTGKKIVSIGCGLFFSMVVTDEGEVYGCGYNEEGQLGLGNYTYQENLSKVTALVSIVIEKIACGPSHALALSDKGELYVWGNNDNGQLGYGIEGSEAYPMKLSVAKMGRVHDIAATECNDISAAMGDRNRVYVWGRCADQVISRPLLIPVARPQDALAFYVTNRPMHQPLMLDAEYETTS